MKKNKINILSIIYNLLLFLFLVVLLLTFLSILGIPRDLRIFVVETGSMEPAISTGSLAVVQPAQSYSEGDIITFNSRLEPGGPKNFVVTHRIQDVRSEDGDTFYTTKGDANENEDPLQANKLDVIGRVSFAIPVLGYIIGFAKTQMGFVLIVVVPSVILIYNEFLNINKELKKVQKERRSREQYKTGMHLNIT